MRKGSAEAKAWGKKMAAARKGGSKKGDKSKTHKGDKDYTTKRGDKDYHRGGHDVKGKKNPFTQRRRL